MSEREIVELRIPDTGYSWRRWLGNLCAWPRYGMHAVWRAEAKRWAAKIADKHPRRVVLHGRSRGAVVALYTAIYLLEHDRHMEIELDLTASLRAFTSRKWERHYLPYLMQCEIQATRAYGDPFGYLPPCWRHIRVERVVGPPVWLKPAAHLPSYIELYNNE